MAGMLLRVPLRRLMFRKKTVKSMKNAAAFSRKKSKKLKRQTVDAKKMVQKPRNLSQKHSLRSTCKNRFFVAIPIIKTTPDSAERRSGFVQRSFHSALRCAMCATKTYMLVAVHFSRLSFCDTIYSVID